MGVYLNSMSARWRYCESGGNQGSLIEQVERIAMIPDIIGFSAAHNALRKVL